MIKHLDLYIQGKVQGVYYRVNTLKQARKLGVTGFVRNEPDGQVHVSVEAEELILVDFVKWCYHGSSQARVDEIEINEAKIQGFKEFLIKY